MELSCIENRPSVRLLNSKYLRTGFLLQAHTKWIWFSILAVEPFSREHVEGMTNKIKMETRSLHNFFPLAIHKGNSNSYLCNYHKDLESKISMKGREQNSDLGFYKGHTHHHKTKSISAFLFLTFQI